MIRTSHRKHFEDWLSQSRLPRVHLSEATNAGAFELAGLGRIAADDGGADSCAALSLRRWQPDCSGSMYVGRIGTPQKGLANR